MRKLWVLAAAVLTAFAGNAVLAEQSGSEQRAAVRPTSYQLSLLDVQRTEVKKMDLVYKIPVAGRFLSASRVAFQIYESDLRYVKIGTTFQGTSDIDPGDEVAGTISSVDTIVDPTSRTVRVMGALRNVFHNALPESEFRGDINVNLKDRVVVPENSVLHTGDNDVVYVFGDGDVLKANTVKLGLKADGFYEVLNGVTPGQTISSGPNFLIDSEAKIQGLYSTGNKEAKPTHPTCPPGQHWDTPMSMCMPGKG